VIIACLDDDDLRQSLNPKEKWGFEETRHTISAILNGQGDEKVLFEKLRHGRSFKKPSNLSDGFFKVWLELTCQVYRFSMHWNRSKSALGSIAP
jgi:hypothetical protein